MTTVDQKVPVIATSACCARLRVEAAGRHDGLSPGPTRWRTGRAQPNCSAIMMPEPTAPPERGLQSERAFQDKAQRASPISAN